MTREEYFEIKDDCVKNGRVPGYANGCHKANAGKR